MCERRGSLCRKVKGKVSEERKILVHPQREKDDSVSARKGQPCSTRITCARLGTRQKEEESRPIGGGGNSRWGKRRSGEGSIRGNSRKDSLGKRPMPSAPGRQKQGRGAKTLEKGKTRNHGKRGEMSAAVTI